MGAGVLALLHSVCAGLLGALRALTMSVTAGARNVSRVRAVVQ